MTPADGSTVPGFDVGLIRADFPILKERVNGKPLVYLDNAASAQKPRAVISAESWVYEARYANVHRGAHHLSAAATDDFELARARTRAFVNAAEDAEIVFTRGATEAINLVAASYGGLVLAPGDEILLTELEHHANIVPWQLIAARTGAVITVAKIEDDGRLPLENFTAALTKRTKIAAFSGMSNALGVRFDTPGMIAAAKAAGAVTLLDACQMAVHDPIDVQALGCDFLVFSGHKIYGPSGVGVLYGRRALLDAMPPWQGGGEMIAEVTFARSTWADLPHKFEAGTPAIAQVIALTAAMDYIADIGWDAIRCHEDRLRDAATARLRRINSLRLHGDVEDKAAILSFTLEGAHHHDVATLIDRQGVAVRSGHHCAQPLMARLGVAGTARASFAVYNTLDEVEALGAAIEKAQRMLG